MNIKTIATHFACTEDRVRETYRLNAAQMRRMAEKAAKTSRKVNGYTTEQLNERAFKFALLSN